jgi:hypothetical protein
LRWSDHSRADYERVIAEAWLRIASHNVDADIADRASASSSPTTSVSIRSPLHPSPAAGLAIEPETPDLCRRRTAWRAKIRVAADCRRPRQCSSVELDVYIRPRHGSAASNAYVVPAGPAPHRSSRSAPTRRLPASAASATAARHCVCSQFLSTLYMGAKSISYRRRGRSGRQIIIVELQTITTAVPVSDAVRHAARRRHHRGAELDPNQWQLATRWFMVSTSG